MGLALQQRTMIGIVVCAIAVAAMAVDHLMGDDPGLEDVPTFAISSGLTLVLALGVFGIAVPRALADPTTAATRAIVLSLLSVLLVPTIWLGLPFPVAGGGIALGLIGRRGGHARRAAVAVLIGTAVVLLGTAVYVEVAIGTDW